MKNLRYFFCFPQGGFNDFCEIIWISLEYCKKFNRILVIDTRFIITFKDDFNVKSRMVYGGIQIMTIYKKELNPFKHLFGLQFFFHKTLRYFMWLLLLLIFIFNILSWNQSLFFNIFLYLQISFYMMAVIGYGLDKFKNSQGIFYLPYYYCSVNLAALKGFIFYLKQQSTVDIWVKAKR